MTSISSSSVLTEQKINGLTSDRESLLKRLRALESSLPSLRQQLQADLELRFDRLLTLEMQTETEREALADFASCYDSCGSAYEYSAEDVHRVILDGRSTVKADVCELSRSLEEEQDAEKSYQLFLTQREDQIQRLKNELSELESVIKEKRRELREHNNKKIDETKYLQHTSPCMVQTGKSDSPLPVSPLTGKSSSLEDITPENPQRVTKAKPRSVAGRSA